ncbi:FecR family protein [Halioglobus pacificus]|uniref:FecR protein domain-containing protein n=1 Tax=Parahalioglobus pacificus TaxID=930806 RepID=A0A918XKZ2_9GAMM|nr:FecR domain-containing protein [Halioglobus pacificus]GHD36678.1 hypothetical protein GCM10007053_25360 [Halioglobus pacificus]
MKALTQLLFALLAVIALQPWSSAFAADAAGTIKTSRGDAHILRNDTRLPAQVGSTLSTSDRIITGATGAVGITLKDNTRLTAGPNTTLDLNTFRFDKTTHKGALDATVQRGSLAVISGKIAKASPDGVQFHTPTVTLGVRGTEFIIEAGVQ